MSNIDVGLHARPYCANFAFLQKLPEVLGALLMMRFIISDIGGSNMFLATKQNLYGGHYS